MIFLKWFGGMIPRLGEQHLKAQRIRETGYFKSPGSIPRPPEVEEGMYATDAQNTDLYSGELRPMVVPSLAHTFTQPTAEDFIEEPETPPPPEPPPSGCIPVTITTHPTAPATLADGALLTLTAETNSDATPPVQYQWYKNGVAVPGAVGPTYTEVVGVEDSYARFQLVVQNPCGGGDGDGDISNEILLPEVEIDLPECQPYACDAFGAGLLQDAAVVVPADTPYYNFGSGNWPYYYKANSTKAPDPATDSKWDLDVYNSFYSTTPVIPGSCYGGSYRSNNSYGCGFGERFGRVYPVSQGCNKAGFLSRNSGATPAEYIIAKANAVLKVEPGTSGSGVDYYNFQTFMTAGLPNNVYGGPQGVLSIGCTAHDGFYYDYADFPAGEDMSTPHTYHMTTELDAWAVEEVYVGCPEGRVWRIKVDVTAICYVDGVEIIRTTDRKSISGTNPGYCIIPNHTSPPTITFDHVSSYLFTNSGSPAYSSHFYMGAEPDELTWYFQRNLLGYEPPEYCPQ